MAKRKSSKAKRASLYDELGNRKDVYLREAPDKPKARCQFPGGRFMLIGLQTFRVLRRLGLPYSVRLVLDWLCENCQYGNTVTNWTQGKIAAELGMHRPNICNILKILVKHQLIKIPGRGVCTLNPHLWFRGSAEQQQEACEAWDNDLGSFAFHWDEELMLQPA